MMIKVAVIGGRGHTGSTLLPLIWRHPECRLMNVGSQSAAGQKVRDEIDGMEDCELVFEHIGAEAIGGLDADAYILALPNGKAEPFVAAIDQLGSQSVIIDLSADYRFDSSWAYGQPERFEQSIRGARRIANPGCYATGAQLALAPLLDSLVSVPAVFGVSGFSGAGKTPSRKNDPEVLRDNLLPYSLTDHIHEREASHHLGKDVRILPHVASFFRGISLTVSAELDKTVDTDSLVDQFEQFYAGNPLVHVTSEIPEVVEVRNTHNVIIGGFAVSRQTSSRISLVAVLDNLLKGAASQAVQNLNISFGLDSLTGLEQ